MTTRKKAPAAPAAPKAPDEVVAVVPGTPAKAEEPARKTLQDRKNEEIDKLEGSIQISTTHEYPIYLHGQRVRIIPHQACPVLADKEVKKQLKLGTFRLISTQQAAEEHQELIEAERREVERQKEMAAQTGGA